MFQSIMKGHWPKTLGYLALVFISVSAWSGFALNSSDNSQMILGNLYDIWFSLIIIAAGIAACSMGAHSAAVLAIGALGTFVVLTVAQEPVIRYLTLSALLFAIGMFGMVKSRNAVRVLMSIELMLNAVNINLITFARFVDPVQIKGQLFAIFILTVAAAEAAVGLAIVLHVYRNLATVDMNRFNLLKW